MKESYIYTCTASNILLLSYVHEFLFGFLQAYSSDEYTDDNYRAI